MSNKKRVVFCTFSSIYSSIVLNKLLSDESIEVISIINSTRILSKKNNSFIGALKQIQLSGIYYASYLFMVTDLFAFFQFLTLHQNKGLKSINKIAKKNHIPILNTRDINALDVVEFIKKKNPDILLAAHFNQLIKSELLELSGMQCLNIHPSLLPSYQGVDPVFYVMLDQCKVSGVTLHRMNEKFDSGDNLSQNKTKISINDSLLTLNKQLFSMGTELAVNYMTRSIKNCVENNLEQPESYDSWPSKKQVKELKRKGVNLISLKHYFNTIFNGS